MDGRYGETYLNKYIRVALIWHEQVNKRYVRLYRDIGNPELLDKNNLTITQKGWHCMLSNEHRIDDSIRNKTPLLMNLEPDTSIEICNDVTDLYNTTRVVFLQKSDDSNERFLNLVVEDFYILCEWIDDELSTDSLFWEMVEDETKINQLISEKELPHTSYRGKNGKGDRNNESGIEMISEFENTVDAYFSGEDEEEENSGKKKKKLPVLAAMTDNEKIQYAHSNHNKRSDKRKAEQENVDIIHDIGERDTINIEKKTKHKNICDRKDSVSIVRQTPVGPKPLKIKGYRWIWMRKDTQEVFLQGNAVYYSAEYCKMQAAMTFRENDPECYLLITEDTLRPSSMIEMLIVIYLYLLETTANNIMREKSDCQAPVSVGFFEPYLKEAIPRVTCELIYDYYKKLRQMLNMHSGYPSSAIEMMKKLYLLDQICVDLDGKKREHREIFYLLELIPASPYNHCKFDQM